MEVGSERRLARVVGSSPGNGLKKGGKWKKRNGAYVVKSARQWTMGRRRGKGLGSSYGWRMEKVWDVRS